MDDDDDPFSVVKPDDSNKKMSSYLKKQLNGADLKKQLSSAYSKKQQRTSEPKCAETSSHETSSTRSTTNSTVPEDSSVTFSSKTPDRTVRRKKSGFNPSASTSAIDFSSDFGNGLEFGQSFGSDGFGMPPPSSRSEPSSRSKPDQKPESCRTFSGTDSFAAFGSDPFVSPTGDDSFNFVTEHEEHEEPLNFGDDGFGMNSFPKKPPSSKKDEASSTKDEAWKKREDWKRTARSNSSSSGLNPRRRGGKKAIPKRHHSTDGVNFDSSSDSVHSGHSGTSGEKSPRVPSKELSRKTRLGGDREKSPSRVHRGKSHERGKSRERGKSSERGKSRERERNKERSPPRRQRSTRRERRSTMNNGEKPESQHSAQQLRERQRRQSMANTNSEGSPEQGNTPIIPPRRQKSTGPAGRKPRRRASIASGDLAFDSMQMNIAQKTSNGGNNNNWSNERSKKQELIMSMYRDGGMASKNENEKKNDSLGDINVNMDMMSMQDDPAGSVEKPRSVSNFLKNAVGKNKFGTSLGDGDDAEEASGHSKEKSRRRQPKKSSKDREPERKTGYEGRDVEGRSKATTLLERVGGDPGNTSSSTTLKGGNDSSSKSMSYSDRMMKAQTRTKRN
jgi:hypothetical protein